MSFEQTILATLQATPGTVVRRDELERAMYGTNDDGSYHVAQSNVLEVIIGRIRKRHGKDRVKTHRGVGYSWEAEA